MTRSRITQGLIAALVIGLMAWIAMHTYWADVTVSTPMEGEAARNPYYSVQRFASAVEFTPAHCVAALPAAAQRRPPDQRHSGRPAA